MSIPHIDDLPILTFLDVVTNLPRFVASIKYDGYNIVLGPGYTSREMKSGTKFYDVEEWPTEFWTTGFRSAHIAAAHLYVTRPVQAEILFGNTPNILTYDGRNRLILFDDVPIPSPVTVELDVPYTIDGTTIAYRPEQHTWEFECLERFQFPDLTDEFLPIIDDIKFFLTRPCARGKTNLDVIAITKPKDEFTKAQQAAITEALLPLKLKIKSILLEFVPDNHEGLVITDNHITTKIVDKNTFTKSNIHVWKVREQIAGKVFGKYKPKSIMGKRNINLLERYRRLYLRYPYDNPDIHQKTLEAFAQARHDLTKKNTDAIAVYFGRFQPFHKGHEQIIKQMKQTYQNSVVVIIDGKRDSKNPLDRFTRTSMLKNVHPHVEVANNPYDWLNAHKNSKVVVYSGNDRTYQQMINNIGIDGEVVIIQRNSLPISGTDLRQAAKLGFYESFQIGKPDCVSEPTWKQVFEEIRNGRL